jgi:DNA (cytosine-5)-methyltransferase 1
MPQQSAKSKDQAARIGVIELFAGASGLAQGFLRAGGYEALALFDIMEVARDSYLKRYPDAVYECRDILDLSARDIRLAVAGQRILGVLGGPPCQGFSLAGLKNPKHDKNALVGHYARLVKQLRPRFLVLENVPQLLYHEQFANLQTELKRSYRLTYAILNAAQYGAPQTRHRLFAIAYHKDLGITPTFPEPTHGMAGQCLWSYRSKRELALSDATAEELLAADPVTMMQRAAQGDLAPIHIADNLLPLVTVGDAISDLYPISPEAIEGAYPKEAQTPYQIAARGEGVKLTNHLPRKHYGAPLQIVKAMPEGGDLADIDPALWPSEKKYFSQAYGRLHRRGLARTLTTFFQNAGSGRYYHYEAERTITVREAARLQGFDDAFEFCGTLQEQMQLVGNAVPIPLAEAIGRHIYHQIGERLINTIAGDAPARSIGRIISAPRTNSTLILPTPPPHLGTEAGA